MPTTITLLRTAEIAGIESQVTVTGEILEENDKCLKMRVTQNVVSNIREDWKAGEVVCFPLELIDN